MMNAVSTLTTCINDLYTHLEGLERSGESDIINFCTHYKKKDEGGLKMSYKGDIGEKKSKLLSYCF
jgi:hypothetical protein